MKTRRGDIVLVLFPNSNMLTAKRRPALVVQADGLATQLSQVIVAMISSNMVRVGPDFRVTIPMNSTLGRNTGLKSDSVVMLDNLSTILDQHIQKKIGSLTNMSLVDAAIRIALAV